MRAEWLFSRRPVGQFADPNVRKQKFIAQGDAKEGNILRRKFPTGVSQLDPQCGLHKSSAMQRAVEIGTTRSNFCVVELELEIAPTSENLSCRWKPQEGKNAPALRSNLKDVDAKMLLSESMRFW